MEEIKAIAGYHADVVTDNYVREHWILVTREGVISCFHEGAPEEIQHHRCIADALLVDEREYTPATREDEDLPFVWDEDEKILCPQCKGMNTVIENWSPKPCDYLGCVDGYITNSR